jgi:molybdopterin-guanine dinucleotide biosynthesis protein A
VGGVALARVALASLRGCVDGSVFVAGPAAFDGWAPGVVQVVDADAGAGPLAGIVGALGLARFGLLVLPCDVPFVQGDTLAAVAALGRRRGRAVAVRGPAGVEPLVAFYPRSALPLLGAALKGGARAPHRLLPRLGALVVAATAAELLNVNRTEDLEAAEARAVRTGGRR